MSKKSALKFIDVYLKDYCTKKQIDTNWKVHTRFLKEMLESIRDEILKDDDAKEILTALESEKQTSKQITDHTNLIIARGGIEYQSDLPNTFPDKVWVPLHWVKLLLGIKED